MYKKYTVFLKKGDLILETTQSFFTELEAFYLKKGIVIEPVAFSGNIHTIQAIDYGLRVTTQTSETYLVKNVNDWKLERVFYYLSHEVWGVILRAYFYKSQKKDFWEPIKSTTIDPIGVMPLPIYENFGMNTTEQYFPNEKPSYHDCKGFGDEPWKNSSKKGKMKRR